MINNPEANYPRFKKQLYDLKSKLWEEQTKLWGVELHKKLCFIRICKHRFTFHKIIHSDIVFVIKYSSSKSQTVLTNCVDFFKSDHDDLECSSLIDILFNDSGGLFIFWENIYDWRKFNKNLLNGGMKLFYPFN